MKRIIGMIVAICLSTVTYCMDDPERGMKSDMSRLETVISINDPNHQDAHEHFVPRLRIRPAAESSHTSASRGTPHTPIANRAALFERIQSQKLTQRTNKKTNQGSVGMKRGRQREEKGIKPLSSTLNPAPVRTTHSDEEDSALIRRRKNSFLPKALPNHVVEDVRKVFGNDKAADISYTEDEVWEMLEIANPILFNFSKKHNFDLERTIYHAKLLQDIDVLPQVITDYAHRDNNKVTPPESLFNKSLAFIFGDANEKHIQQMNKRYEAIKKASPQDYETLVLQLLKEIDDEVEGRHQRSPIDDTHSRLQNDELAAKAYEIRVQYVAMVVGLITACGGWAFGLVGQLLNPAGNHTS